MLSLEASDIIALAAVFVATVVAISTVVQTFLLRQHYRLSVAPHIERIDQDQPHGEYHEVALIICNEGIGPAVIKDYIVYYKVENKEDEILGSLDNRKGLRNNVNKKIEEEKNVQEKIKKIEKEIVKEKRKNKKDIIENSIWFFSKGSSLPSQSKQVLLKINRPISVKDKKEIFFNFISKIHIEFIYEDIYGKQFYYPDYIEKHKRRLKMRRSWWERCYSFFTESLKKSRKS